MLSYNNDSRASCESAFSGLQMVWYCTQYILSEDLKCDNVFFVFESCFYIRDIKKIHKLFTLFTISVSKNYSGENVDGRK